MTGDFEIIRRTLTDPKFCITEPEAIGALNRIWMDMEGFKIQLHVANEETRRTWRS